MHTHAHTHNQSRFTFLAIRGSGSIEDISYKRGEMKRKKGRGENGRQEGRSIR